MFSLAWRPDPKSNEPTAPWNQLSLIIGLAVAEAIDQYLVSPLMAQVKWPNDVYVNQKKIAGILVEHLVGPGKPTWVIGIGINVFVPIDQAPRELMIQAESLHRVVSSVQRDSLSKESVLDEILDSLQTIDR